MLFGRHVNKFYKKYWYLFAILFLCDAVVDIAQLLIPKILGDIINGFEAGTFTYQATATLSFYQTDFFKTMISISVIAIIIVLGRIGWRYFSAKIGSNVERDLRKEMFAHIETMSLEYYNGKKVGGLLSFFTNDLETIKMCFSDVLIFSTDLVVLGTCSFVFMALMNWKITLACSAPLLLFTILGGFIGKAEAKRYKDSNDAFETLSDFTEENLQGFSVIKAYLKEEERKASFRTYAADAGDKNVSYLKISSLINSGINFLLAITFTILFLLATNALLGNLDGWLGGFRSCGDLMTFTGYYDSLIWPMIAGGMIIDNISRGRGALKRVSTILDSKPDIIDSPTSIKRDHIQGEVEFRDLSFAYPDGDKRTSLSHISFHVEPGMTVGLIGRTGCGKSTLVSLLPKLYNLPKDTLFIDGVDINDWRKDDLREHQGYVLQEGFLFSGTIKENIAFSDDNLDTIDMERVKEAARFADIDTDIVSFPEGYDTIVGEKGATLSGGQRQRVSIARAYYKNPDMLILDDSLSAVDADTEKQILDNIRNSEKRPTTFVIAHRVSAIENADLILVLDEGKLVGLGKHDELYASCHLYHEICDLQQLEKEVNQ